MLVITRTKCDVSIFDVGGVVELMSNAPHRCNGSHICIFFFFKQKTAYEMRISDWSSDVCSSDLIAGEPRLLRPHNFPAGTPGRGSGVFETRRGKKVLVLNVMGALFMEDLDDPFACIAAELEIGRASCRARVCQYV